MKKRKMVVRDEDEKGRGRSSGGGGGDAGEVGKSFHLIYIFWAEIAKVARQVIALVVVTLSACLLSLFWGVFHFFVHCFSMELLPRYVLEFMCRCMCARVCMKHCSGAFITTANGSAGIEPCPASAMAPGRKGCIYFSLANTERCCCCCCAFIDTARKGLTLVRAHFYHFRKQKGSKDKKGESVFLFI